MGCLIHKWNGCKCVKCGKVRNKKHNWDGCTCSTCGQVRDSNHSWSVIAESFSGFNIYKEICTCQKCGTVRDSHHAWKCGVCELCGKIDETKGHVDGYYKNKDGGFVETYCLECRKLIKTNTRSELFETVTRRIQNADDAGATDRWAEYLYDWLIENKP